MKTDFVADNATYLGSAHFGRGDAETPFHSWRITNYKVPGLWNAISRVDIAVTSKHCTPMVETIVTGKCVCLCDHPCLRST